MEQVIFQIIITIIGIIFSFIVTTWLLGKRDRVKYIPQPPIRYKAGDYIAVKRSGTNEIIQGKIKQVYKDLVWGHDLAIVDTDKGERLITSETDTFRSGF